MRQSSRSLWSVLALCLTVGCASGRGLSGEFRAHGVLAVAPGGGEVSHAIAIELEQHGYTIVDGAATSRLMSKLNVSEIDMAMPHGLAALSNNGVDAVLFVTASGGDEELQRATVRMTRTRDAQLVAGVNWENGRSARSLTEAAGEIASELIARAQ